MPLARAGSALAVRVAALGVLIALLFAATPGMAVVATDTWITTRVKMRLLVSSEVDGTAIHADSDRGRVTLFGIVSSDAERTPAQHIAEQIVGVQSVRNLIAVVPSRREEAVERADHTLRENVGLALREDPALRNSAIHVESVDAGTVVLGGRADSLSELRRALWIARGVAGVRRVASVADSPQQLSDAESWGDAMAEQDNAARDNWLATAVKRKLIVDERVPAQEVSVDAQDGVVILFGTVPNDAAKHAAQVDAADVPGVSGVKNEILVRHPQPESHDPRG